MTDTTESSEPSDSEPDQPDRGMESTSGTSQRWWLTNDLLAWYVTVTTTLLAIGAAWGWLDPQRIPAEMLAIILLAYGTAIAWAFGKDAVEAWRGGK